MAGIAEKNHVYSIASNQQIEAQERLKFKTTGTRQASVFPGFCENHDASFFRSIETEDGELSSLELLALAYRGICHELYKKKKIEYIFSHREFLKAASEIGVGAVKYARAHLQGTRLALRDLQIQKASLERSFNKQDVSSFEAVYFEMEEALPFAFSSAFAPEFTLDGKALLPDDQSVWNSVTAFCGNIKSRPVFGFAGLNDIKSHDTGQFFSSLENVPDERIGSIALHTAIEHSENTFFRISWIDHLLPEIKTELLSRFATGVPGKPNSRKKKLAEQFDIVKIASKKKIRFAP